MTVELLGANQERPEMYEGPRLFDDLGLVALPTAISCARMFAQITLANWKASAFVVADVLSIARELISLSVHETGASEDITWAELDRLNRIVVRLLGFSRHIVIEVWDAATEPAVTTDEPHTTLPQGIDLVDVVARRWGSAVSEHGRLTWAEVAVYDRTDSGLPIRPVARRPHPGSPPLVDDEILRRLRDGLNSW